MKSLKYFEKYLISTVVAISFSIAISLFLLSLPKNASAYTAIQPACKINAGTYRATVTTYSGYMNVSYSCRNGRSGRISHSIPSLTVPINFYLGRTVYTPTGVYGTSGKIRLDQACANRGWQCVRLCQVFNCSTTYVTLSARGTLSCYPGRVNLTIQPNGIATSAHIALTMHGTQCNGTGFMITGGTASLYPH